MPSYFRQFKDTGRMEATGADAIIYGDINTALVLQDTCAQNAMHAWFLCFLLARCGAENGLVGRGSPIPHG